jgi:hypothetical protein
MYDGVDYDGTIRLLELDEVPQEFLEEFNSGKCILDLCIEVLFHWNFSPQIQSLQHQQFVDQSQRQAQSWFTIQSIAEI